MTVVSTALGHKLECCCGVPEAPYTTYGHPVALALPDRSSCCPIHNLKPSLPEQSCPARFEAPPVGHSASAIGAALTELIVRIRETLGCNVYVTRPVLVDSMEVIPLEIRQRAWMPVQKRAVSVAALFGSSSELDELAAGLAESLRRGDDAVLSVPKAEEALSVGVQSNRCDILRACLEAHLSGTNRFDSATEVSLVMETLNPAQCTRTWEVHFRPSGVAVEHSVLDEALAEAESEAALMSEVSQGVLDKLSKLLPGEQQEAPAATTDWTAQQIYEELHSDLEAVADLFVVYAEGRGRVYAALSHENCWALAITAPRPLVVRDRKRACVNPAVEERSLPLDSSWRAVCQHAALLIRQAAVGEAVSQAGFERVATSAVRALEVRGWPEAGNTKGRFAEFSRVAAARYIPPKGL